MKNSEIDRLTEVGDLSGLSDKEKLSRSYDIFNALKETKLSRPIRKKLLEKYRELTYDIAKQHPAKYDPIENVSNFGYADLYNSIKHSSSDKILSTLKDLKKYNVVYVPDKIDLLNHIKYESENNEKFIKGLKSTPERLLYPENAVKDLPSKITLLNYLNHLKNNDSEFKEGLKITPKKLKEKYPERTTESRFKYTLNLLEKEQILKDRQHLRSSLKDTNTLFSKLITESDASKKREYLTDYNRLVEQISGENIKGYDPINFLEESKLKELLHSDKSVSDKIMDVRRRIKKTTTESRHNYLINALESDFLLKKEPESVKKVFRVSHDYNRNQGGLQEHLQELNKGLSEKGDIDMYQIIPLTKKQFSKLQDEGKIKKEGDLFFDSYSGVKILPIFISQEEKERMARLNRHSITTEYMKQFEELFNDINPDIVHVHNGYYRPHNMVAKLSKSKGKKVVHTWHGGEIDPVNKNAKERLRQLFNDTEKFSDYNFAISEVGKSAFERDDVKVEYGVDLKNYDPNKINELDISAHKSKLGINDKDYVFFFPGRYHEQKNQHSLLEAFEKVAKNNKNTKLVLAGQKFDDESGNNYHSKLMDYARQKGIEDKVIFYDKIDKKDMPLFYAVSDAVIYPSKNEGRGRSLIEAMAMGKTVLASNDAGLKDSIKTESGDVGYLFNPDDVQEIADKMVESYSDIKKSKSLAYKSKHHAHKNLSIDNYVNKYHAVYNGN